MGQYIITQELAINLPAQVIVFRFQRFVSGGMPKSRLPKPVITPKLVWLRKTLLNHNARLCYIAYVSITPLHTILNYSKFVAYIVTFRIT